MKTLPNVYATTLITLLTAGTAVAQRPVPTEMSRPIVVGRAAQPSNPATLTAVANPLSLQYPVCQTAGGAPGFTPCYFLVSVRLTWTEVRGAAYYVVYGPAVVPTTGLQTTQTSVDVTSNATSKIAWGDNTWTVAALFLPGPVSTDPANYTKVSLNIPEPKRP